MKIWDRIFQDGVLCDKPDEIIVELSRLFKEKDVKSILEIGCGDGVNLTFLAQEGFKVDGCDISEEGLKLCRKKLDQNDITNVELKQLDFKQLDYKPESHDAIICHKVLEHGYREEIFRVINSLKKILKPKGIIHICSLSTKSEIYKTGKEIGEQTRINIDLSDGELPHHFLTKQDLENLFSDFSILKQDTITLFTECHKKKVLLEHIIAQKP